MRAMVVCLSAFLCSVTALGQAAAPSPSSSDSRIWIPLPERPGTYAIQFQATIDGKAVRLPFALYLPKDYQPQTEPRPTILFLHGPEQRGKDLSVLTSVGPIGAIAKDPKMAEAVRAIVVAPQCPADMSWENPQITQALLALLDEVGKTYRVDKERVVAAGVSIGGVGATNLAAAAPDRFASLTALSASAFNLEGAAEKLRYTRTHLISSAKDPQSAEGSRRLASALKLMKPDVLLSIDPGDPQEVAARQFADVKWYEAINNTRRLNEQQRKERDAHLAAMAKALKEPGHHRLVFETRIGDQQIRIPYMVYLPPSYEKQKDPWPMLVFMHGAGEGENLDGMFVHGPASLIKSDPKFAETYPFFTLYPRYGTIEPHTIKATLQLVDEVCEKWRIDRDRVCISGLSLGGTATWALAMEGPDRFAAIAPMCGRAYKPDQVSRLRNLATRIIVGGNDGDFTKGAREMAAALLQSDCVDLSVRMHPGQGHNIWTTTYADPSFYQWLLTHKRRKP